MARPKNSIKTICGYCGKDIPSWRVYCNLECYHNGKSSNAGRIFIFCANCNKQVSILKSKAQRRKLNFCSRKCYIKSSYLMYKGKDLGINNSKKLSIKNNNTLILSPMMDHKSKCCYKKVVEWEGKYYCEWCGKEISQWIIKDPDDY